MRLRLLILCAGIALLVSLLTNVTLFVTKDRSTVWQYDGWRAQWLKEQAEEEARKKVEAIRQEQIRTNRNSVTDYGLSITNAINYYNGLAISRWYGEPHFDPGTIELGYRKDGTMTWRNPPESHGVSAWEAMLGDLRRFRDWAGTNWSSTNAPPIVKVTL